MFHISILSAANGLTWCFEQKMLSLVFLMTDNLDNILMAENPLSLFGRPQNPYSNGFDEFDNGSKYTVQLRLKCISCEIKYY